MIIWSGWGLAVVVISMGALIGVEYGVEAALGQPDYYQRNAWPPILGGILASVGLWFLSRWLDGRARRAQVGTELQGTDADGAGDTPAPRAKDSLLFIPVRFWVWIVPLVCVIAAFTPR